MRQLGIVLLVIGSLSVGLFYLSSEMGKKQLVVWVNESLSNEEDHVVLSSVEGSLFSSFTLSKLTVADRQGVWLEIENTYINWSPIWLFSRQVTISDLGVNGLRLHRLPKKSDEGGGLSLPFAITIANYDISNIELATELIETSATFESKGSLELTRPDHILIQASLNSSSKDSDEIDINIEYLGKGHDLLADIQLKVSQGGALMALAGMDIGHDLMASLKGRGPLEDWSGGFTVQADESNLVDATVRRIGKNLTVQAKMNAEMLEPVIGSDLFGGSASLLFTANPAEISERMKLSLDIKSKTMRLKANGIMPEGDAETDEKIDFSFEIIDPEPFKQIVAPLSFHPFSVSGALGIFKGDPKVTITLDELDADVNAIFGGRIGGQLEAIFRKKSIDYSGSGRIDAIEGTSVKAYSSLVKTGFDWTFDGTFDQKIIDTEFLISNKFITLSGTENYVRQTGAIAADIKTFLNDISDLNPDISGQMTMTVQVHQADAVTPLLAAVAVTTEDLNFSDDRMNEIFSARPTFAANIRRTAAGALEIIDASLASKHLALEASANISTELLIDSAQYHLAISELENIKGIKDLALEGRVDASGSLSGSLAEPSLTMEVGLNQLDIQGLKLNNVLARMSADNIFDQPNGNIAIESETNLGVLSGKADFAIDEKGSYKISAIDMAMGAYRAHGAIKALSGKPAIGTVTLVTENMQEIGGGLQGAIKAEIKLANEGGLQRVILSSNVTKIKFPVGDNEIVTLSSGQLTAAALFGDTTPQITLEAQLTDMSHPRLQSSDVRLNIGSDLDSLTYDMRLKGTEFMPYELSLAGTLSRDVDKNMALSLGFEGSIDDVFLSAKDPILASITNDGYKISPFIVRLGDGQIQSDLAMIKNEMRAKIVLEKLDLRPFIIFVPELPFTGLLDGKLLLNATPDAVDGELALVLSSIRYSDDGELIDPDFTVSADGKLNKKGVKIVGVARIIDLLDAQFSAELPLLIDAESNHILLQDDQPLKGELVWQGNLGPIWPFFDLVNHDLSGKVDTKLMVSGTIANPHINGHLRLAEGRYENLRTGFVAANIDMASIILNRHFSLEHFTANDGGDGDITAEATIDFNPDFTYQARGELNLSHAHLIRQPEIDVTASSNIILIKDASTTQISGDVTVENANVGAVTQGGPNIVDLEVREINSEGRETYNQETTSTHIGPFNLDLKFTAPGKLFIRSYGIDSEWKAAINMSGTSDAPIVAGSAELIRGTFEFSGKRFALTNGTCIFPTDGSNDPILDIRAEHKLVNFTAIIHITGRASSPILNITSTPSMPQDEVLSRILFGTSTTELSAMEAVQLATTLHSLSKGGGPGVVGGIRRALGINRLSIDSNKDHEYGTTITGGKYLTDNIYVEVTTAPSTGDSATSVEVRITNNLSLVSRRTLDHDNNLAIRWSWNY